MRPDPVCVGLRVLFWIANARRAGIFLFFLARTREANTFVTRGDVLRIDSRVQYREEMSRYSCPR